MIKISFIISPSLEYSLFTFLFFKNLDLQIDSLEKDGCEKIFQEHMSGSKSKRPGLGVTMDFCRPGDTLVVWRLDRLGRNIEELVRVVNALNDN